jgi:hypothetical protein
VGDPVAVADLGDLEAAVAEIPELHLMFLFAVLLVRWW